MNNRNVRETDNAQMSNLLAYHGASKSTVSFEAEVKKWFSDNSRRMRSLCGNEDDARRLLLAALNSVSKTPTLMECTFESFARCLLTSAEYRLFPGAMAHCAYVPFMNNKIGVREATFVLMYQGLLELLYRNDKIMDIECEVVRERDYFNHQYGTDRKLEFEPFDGDRGERVKVYCIIRLTNGGQVIKVLTRKQVEALKARSKAANSTDSPWNSKHESDVDWMWMKTALKQNKYVPKSPTAAAAIADDGDAEDESSGSMARAASAIGNAPPAPPQPAQPKTIEHEQRTTIDIPVSRTPVQNSQPQAENAKPNSSTVVGK